MQRRFDSRCVFEAFVVGGRQLWDIIQSSENDQEGSRNWHPRHVYANSADPVVCVILALMEYLCVFPEVLSDPDGRLFPGAAAQEKRFGEILGKILAKHKTELELMGYKQGDITVHSIRKGATTYATSGTTAAPNTAAVNNRGGWSFGGVRDVYMLYERAGDQYVGRVLAGMDVLSHEFAAMNPDFYPVDPAKPTEYTQQQVEDLDKEVDDCLGELFGISRFVAPKFLRVGLACLLLI